MDPKDAAKRLDSICQELRNYNVELEDVEALRRLSLRFQFHLSKLASFQKRLSKWSEGLPC